METFTLNVGDSKKVSLPGLGSAGYRWSAAMDVEGVVRIEHIPSKLSLLAAGSRDEHFRITGQSRGRVTVHFELKRSFAPGQPPHSTQDYLVKVV